MGGLAGMLLIKSRLVKASLMAGISSLFLLLAAMFKQMVDYQTGLLVAFSNTEHPSPWPQELLSYYSGIMGKITAYSGDLQIVFWMLLLFLLAAPFVMVWQKRKPA
jgi:hypothetical protein